MLLDRLSQLADLFIVEYFTRLIGIRPDLRQLDLALTTLVALLNLLDHIA